MHMKIAKFMLCLMSINNIMIVLRYFFFSRMKNKTLMMSRDGKHKKWFFSHKIRTWTKSHWSHVWSRGFSFSFSFLGEFWLPAIIQTRLPFGCFTVISACFPCGTSCYEEKKIQNKMINWSTTSLSFYPQSNSIIINGTNPPKKNVSTLISYMYFVIVVQIKCA